VVSPRRAVQESVSSTSPRGSTSPRIPSRRTRVDPAAVRDGARQQPATGPRTTGVVEAGGALEVFSKTKQVWLPGLLMAVNVHNHSVAPGSILVAYRGGAETPMMKVVVPSMISSFVRSPSLGVECNFALPHDMPAGTEGFARGDGLDVFSKSAQTWVPGRIVGVGIDASEGAIGPGNVVVVFGPEGGSLYSKVVCAAELGTFLKMPSCAASVGENKEDPARDEKQTPPRESPRVLSPTMGSRQRCKSALLRVCEKTELDSALDQYLDAVGVKRRLSEGVPSTPPPSYRGSATPSPAGFRITTPSHHLARFSVGSPEGPASITVGARMFAVKGTRHWSAGDSSVVLKLDGDSAQIRIDGPERKTFSCRPWWRFWNLEQDLGATYPTASRSASGRLDSIDEAVWETDEE